MTQKTRPVLAPVTLCLLGDDILTQAGGDAEEGPEGAWVSPGQGHLILKGKKEL